MAYYLVKAKVRPDQLTELKARLERGDILTLRPFGQALNYSLQNARLDPAGWAVWEEEDYCCPPLAEERAAVLDDYFDGLSFEAVPHREGWRRIASLPPLFPEFAGS